MALRDFLTESKGVKPCDIQKIIAAVPDYTGARFSDVPRLRDECWFSLGEVTNYIIIHCWQVISLLTENRRPGSPEPSRYSRAE
jgi:hypothetical protein